MHYVVFIPGQTNATDGLREVGLLPLAENVSFEPCPHGPDGTAGVLCQWMTNRGAVHRGYVPAKQTWIPAVADGDDRPAARYWVGLWNESPPTPDELLRAYPYPGTKVRLGDNRDWLFPNATQIPRDMIRQDDGSTAFLPQRNLHHFALAADKWKSILSGLYVGAAVFWQELRDFLELGLAVNYRMIPEVADHLRLWSHTEAGTCWQAALAMFAPERLGEVRRE